MKKRHLLDQSEPVIKRWIRIRMTARGQRLARLIMRHWLPLREQRRRKALEEAFIAVKDLTIEHEHSAYRSTFVICNIALFFLLAERDIQAAKIAALTHPDLWTRHLHLRLILLTIHEWDMDKVCGAKLKQALDELKVSNDVKKEVSEALRSIRREQRRARREFNYLRNLTIAHRDPDALSQYRAIRNINSTKVLSLASNFYDAADSFVGLLARILRLSSSPNSLFLQLLSKQRTSA